MYRKILVPIDGSDTARRGLQEALKLARACDAGVVLLHVIDSTPMAMEVASPQTWDALIDGLRQHGRTLLDTAAAEASAQRVPCESVLVDFPTLRVADSILEQAQRHACDLIVMGTHGRRGVGHLLLGSDAERVLRTSTLPVLTVRQS